MKNLYVCERCGKQFEDYDEAYACENSHVGVGDYQEVNDMSPIWNPGDIMPSKVTLESEKWWDSEAQEYKTHVAVYKLQKILSPSETAEFMRKREERKAKEEQEYKEWREAWEKEQEERKRTKEILEAVEAAKAEQQKDMEVSANDVEVKVDEVW